MDAVWERWDLVCGDSCEPIDQVLRIIIWSYLFIAFLIFYAAIRPWTMALPRVAGIGLSIIGSLIIVWVARDLVASSGSLRTAGVITGLGLLAVWIGRPAFLDRSDPTPVDPDLNGNASPTSSTH